MAFKFETRIPDTGMVAMVKGALHGAIVPGTIYLWLMLMARLEEKLAIDAAIGYLAFAAVMYEVLEGKDEARRHFVIFAAIFMMALFAMFALTGGVL